MLTGQRQTLIDGDTHSFIVMTTSCLAESVPVKEFPMFFCVSSNSFQLNVAASSKPLIRDNIHKASYSRAQQSDQGASVTQIMRLPWL